MSWVEALAVPPVWFSVTLPLEPTMRPPADRLPPCEIVGDGRPGVLADRDVLVGADRVAAAGLGHGAGAERADVADPLVADRSHRPARDIEVLEVRRAAVEIEGAALIDLDDLRGERAAREVVGAGRSRVLGDDERPGVLGAAQDRDRAGADDGVAAARLHEVAGAVAANILEARRDAAGAAQRVAAGDAGPGAEDDRLLAGNVGAGVLQERAGARQADDLRLRGAEGVGELADRDEIALVQAVDEDIGARRERHREGGGDERGGGEQPGAASDPASAQQDGTSGCGRRRR